MHGHAMVLLKRRSSCTDMQYVVCRQKPNAINAMTAGILLRDLAGPGMLEPEAAQVLISIVQREKTIGQSLGAVLHEAAPALEKMVCCCYAVLILSLIHI